MTMTRTRLFSALAALTTLLLTCACEPLTKEEKARATEYVGTVTVEYKGETNKNPDIRVHYLPADDGGSARIVIYRIRFVPQMPVTIDVTIPDVSVTQNGQGFSLQADNVIPLALGGEYEKYRVTALSGTLTDNKLSFSLNFGEYPTSFTGTLTADPS